MIRNARRHAAFLVLIASLVMALTPSAWAITQPRASLTDIESDVMCTACGEPLAVANSPEAQSERSYIRALIAKGLTKPQIEQNLVRQYGPAVLGKPPAHGVNLTIYILPPAIVAVGIGILAVTLPRWRRRTRAARSDVAEALPPLDPADQERLNHELSQFRG